jgi:hypothetical protein
MDFSLTKEQQDFKRAAREFAEKEFPVVAQKCDEEEKMDMSLLKKARELGFVGVHIPERYGGFGMNYLKSLRFTRGPKRSKRS